MTEDTTKTGDEATVKVTRNGKVVEGKIIANRGWSFRWPHRWLRPHITRTVERADAPKDGE